MTEETSLSVIAEAKEKSDVGRWRELAQRADDIRQKTYGRLIGGEAGMSAKAHKHLAANSSAVRDGIFDILSEIDDSTKTTVIDHYASMGLKFLPEDSDKTHPLIQVEKRIPDNPIPDKPILFLIRDALDRHYRNYYKRQHASSARRISLFSNQTIERQSQTRSEMISHYLRDGKFSIHEPAKIHETAHCSNTFEFDYEDQEIGIAKRIHEGITPLRRTPLATSAQEIHSMIAEHALTGTQTRTEPPVNSVKDIAAYSMIHPHVSPYEHYKLTAGENLKMAERLMSGETENLPGWFLDRYQRAEEAKKNVLRTIAIEKTIGKAGTAIGRLKRKEKLMTMKNGRMIHWEKELVKSAKSKGLVPNNLKFEEALVELDKLTEKKVEELDIGAAKVKIAMSTGIVTSLENVEGLPDSIKEKAREARKVIEEAQKLS